MAILHAANAAAATHASSHNSSNNSNSNNSGQGQGPGIITLHDCLKAFTSLEELDENSWYCDHCRYIMIRSMINMS